jgi:mannosyl-oligosaccharide glucosidase
MSSNFFFFFFFFFLVASTMTKSSSSTVSTLVSITVLAIAALAALWALNDETDTTTSSLELISVQTDSTRLWGSYRPSVYLGGMKTRTALPVMTGAMWLGVNANNATTFARVRHVADQNDRLAKYSWLAHDGRSFGRHDVVDRANGVRLTSSFVKRNASDARGGDWAIRIRVDKLPDSSLPGDDALAVLFYVGVENPAGALKFSNRPRANEPLGRDAAALISAVSPETGEFSMRVSATPLGDAWHDDELPSDSLRADVPSFARPDAPHWGAWQKKIDDMWTVQTDIEQHIVARFRNAQREVNDLARRLQAKGKPLPPMPRFVPMLGNRAEPSSNIVAVQFVHKLPFYVDVALVSHAVHPTEADRDAAFRSLHGEQLDALLDDGDAAFRARLVASFPRLASADARRRSLAEAAFANLLGGMGYWFGSNVIYEGETGPADPKTGKPQKRYSVTTPPLPLYSAVPSRPFFPRGFLWDEGFHQLIIAHFDEQIALDALSHWYNRMHADGWIPREQILGREAESKVPHEFQAQHREHANPPTLLLAVERLLQTPNEEKLAFLRSAWPRLERHYAWWASSQRGALPASFRWRGRTYNHTLSSGFDDYPRQNPPNDGELHLDGLCWMIFFSRTMTRLATLLDLPQRATHFAAEQAAYTTTLHTRHWNDATQLYADANTDGTFSPHVGYVSLFPVILGVIEPDSPRLAGITRALVDPAQLWSEFGILSLSRADPLFGSGENYWKGAIWININYMLVAAIESRYAAHNSELAALGARLRERLVDNLLTNFERTGFIWEQYHPDTGEGQRSHPFTGWSALVTLLI